MSTRSKSDKDEVEKTYQSAINLSGSRKKKDTSCTQNPVEKDDKRVVTDPFASSERIARTPTKRTTVDESEISRAGPSVSLGSSENTPLGLGDEKPFPDETFSTADTLPLNETMSQESSNPFVTLKYAVEAVPFFDGTNIPLSYFIEGCEEAKSMLPKEAEPQFTKVIRTRIVGEARRTIQDQNFSTISQLTKYLKQVFGSPKSVYQLQGELGCVYQKEKEDVIAYSNRVKALGRQILEAYQSSREGYPSQDIKADLERDMTRCFIRGLKPEIEQRISRELDVQGTVADALRIERELHTISDIRRGSHVNLSTSKAQTAERKREICQICSRDGHTAAACRKLGLFPQNKEKTVNFGTEILVCQICKKRGHSAEKCYLREPRSRQCVNIVQETRVVCQVCSKIGHNAKECRFNGNKNQFVKTSVICQWCNKPGHSAINCWKKQSEQREPPRQSRIVCQICNNLNHTAKECRSGRYGVNKGFFCRYCKEPGHFLENCKLRIARDNQRQTQNQGNLSGPLKQGVSQGTEQSAHPVASAGATPK